jgi:prevent-host-death family protein
MVPVAGTDQNWSRRRLDWAGEHDHHGHVRTTASIAEVKARLSEFVRRVKAGDEVVVTDRGVPVARLTGLEAGERRATRRDRLARTGVVKPGKGRVRRVLQSAPEGKAGGAEVLAALVADRDEGR